MKTFGLDSKLAEDSIYIADLALSQLRLINNSHYTWLILVPRVCNVSELLDLDATLQQLLLTEINLAAKLLKQHFPCDKINIASLGNVVSQLHIHVIARVHNDVQWPKPVWGGPQLSYTAEQISQIVTKLRQLI